MENRVVCISVGGGNSFKKTSVTIGELENLIDDMCLSVASLNLEKHDCKPFIEAIALLTEIKRMSRMN